MTILIAEARARGHAGPLGLPRCDWDGEVFGAGKAKAAADEVEFTVDATDTEAGSVGERGLTAVRGGVGRRIRGRGEGRGVVVDVLAGVSAFEFGFRTFGLLGGVHDLLPMLLLLLRQV